MPGSIISLEEARQNLAAIIDHTLLKPEASASSIEQLCREALTYRFAAVCVNPCHVATCVRLLHEQVPVATVVGFPLGANTTPTKVYETREAVQAGAQEIDMVINIGALKSGALDYVADEIAAIVAAAQPAIVKVIIETALLTDDEKRLACQLALKAGAHFVKTSTGFSKGGATVEDVRLMRNVVGDRMGVKASGGIRSLQDALAMVEAGANRLGTSSGVAILEELRAHNRN